MRHDHFYRKGTTSPGDPLAGVLPWNGKKN